jgi:undecaprenyl-diphosphatase
VSPPLAASLIAGAAVALVAAIGVTVAGPVPTFDAAGMALANSFRHPALDRAFAAITWFGSLAVLLPLAVAVAFTALPRLGWQAACVVPATLLATATAAHAIKLAVDRKRPALFPSPVEMPVDPSFPSAHAAQATAFFLAALAVLAVPARPGVAASTGRWLVLGAIALLGIMAVGASRIYLQVHFPSDVLAGTILGTASVPAADLLLRALARAGRPSP